MNTPWNDPSVAPNGRSVCDNFNVWFEDSCATQHDGRPWVFFHGTSTVFDAFSTNRSGSNFSHRMSPALFFTSSAADASVYSDVAAHGQCDVATLGGQILLPVFLRIQYPLEVRAPSWPDAWFDDHSEELFISARAGEHDGIVVRGGRRGQCASSLVVFDAGQVKSALGNSGLYLADSHSLTDTVAGADLTALRRAKVAMLTAFSEATGGRRVFRGASA